MAVQFVLGDLPIQRITVDSQDLRGFGLVTTGFVEGVLDEPLFEFIHGFVQINPALNHLCDKGFQLLFHNLFLVGRLFVFLFTSVATSAPTHGSQLEISLSFRRESLRR